MSLPQPSLSLNRMLAGAEKSSPRSDETHWSGGHGSSGETESESEHVGVGLGRDRPSERQTDTRPIDPQVDRRSLHREAKRQSRDKRCERESAVRETGEGGEIKDIFMCRRSQCEGE